MTYRVHVVTRKNALPGGRLSRIRILLPHDPIRGEQAPEAFLDEGPTRVGFFRRMQEVRVPSMEGAEDAGYREAVREKLRDAAEERALLKLLLLSPRALDVEQRVVYTRSDSAAQIRRAQRHHNEVADGAVCLFRRRGQVLIRGLLQAAPPAHDDGLKEAERRVDAEKLGVFRQLFHERVVDLPDEAPPAFDVDAVEEGRLLRDEAQDAAGAPTDHGEQARDEVLLAIPCGG